MRRSTLRRMSTGLMSEASDCPSLMGILSVEDTQRYASDMREATWGTHGPAKTLLSTME